MPPAGAKRPDAGRIEAFTAALEASLDRASAADPNPGRPALHRLNRTEYANAVRDILALDIDVTKLLPPDDMTHGFDNIADVLTISPTLMDSYVRTAATISRLAVGDRAIVAGRRGLPRAADAPADRPRRRHTVWNARRHCRATFFSGRRRVLASG